MLTKLMRINDLFFIHITWTDCNDVATTSDIIAVRKNDAQRTINLLKSIENKWMYSGSDWSLWDFMIQVLKAEKIKFKVIEKHYNIQF